MRWLNDSVPPSSRSARHPGSSLVGQVRHLSKRPPVVHTGDPKIAFALIAPTGNDWGGQRLKKTGGDPPHLHHTFLKAADLQRLFLFRRRLRGSGCLTVRTGGWLAPDRRKAALPPTGSRLLRLKRFSSMRCLGNWLLARRHCGSIVHRRPRPLAAAGSSIELVLRRLGAPSGSLRHRNPKSRTSHDPNPPYR